MSTSKSKTKTTRKRKSKYHVGRIPVSQIEFIRSLATDDLKEIQTIVKSQFGNLLKTERIAKYREGLTPLNNTSNQEFTVTINHKNGKKYSLREFFHSRMQDSFDENMAYVMDNIYRQLTSDDYKG